MILDGVIYIFWGGGLHLPQYFFTPQINVSGLQPNKLIACDFSTGIMELKF